MAGTVVQGNVSTEEVQADERQIDMSERIAELRPDETPFVTMTSRLVLVRGRAREGQLAGRGGLPAARLDERAR